VIRTTSESGVAATATDGQHPGEGLTHRQILVVFTGLMMGLLLAALDQTIVATALPTIVGQLHGLNRLTWVVTSYLLTSTASTPLYGKLSDLYGRRRIFQFAIVVFLIGSALAGLSQNINELIVTRGLQGIGAGGLMTLAMAIVGDVVPPRQRGRYQGYFTSVFAAASVAGPLIGGFFVQHLSWRWIFYVNVPIGVVALVVTSAVLKMEFPRRDHVIDYLGSLLMVVAVSCLLLVTVWGGNTYSWTSAEVLVTGGVGIGFGVAFVFRERRAPEPIIPLRLFSNSVFTVCNVAGFIMGTAMFGVIVFLPLYLQLVKGVSPTVSGLLLLPVMGGLLVSSILSGRAISAIGRYRMFAVVGTATAAVGILALTTLGVDTNQAVMSLELLVLGVGIGMSMPVLTIAVQNGVSWRDMGTATASVNFFRSLGGSIGTAAFGAVLVDRLSANLARDVPAGVLAHLPGGKTITGSPASVHKLAPAVQAPVLHAFTQSLDTVFICAVPLMALAFILSLFLKDVRLRDSVGDDGHAVQTSAASFLLEGAVDYADEELPGAVS
jgi:EmrB/QacA subfamily drug resistance transporter